MITVLRLAHHRSVPFTLVIGVRLSCILPGQRFWKYRIRQLFDWIFFYKFPTCAGKLKGCAGKLKACLCSFESCAENTSASGMKFQIWNIVKTNQVGTVLSFEYILSGWPNWWAYSGVLLVRWNLQAKASRLSKPGHGIHSFPVIVIVLVDSSAIEGILFAWLSLPTQPILISFLISKILSVRSFLEHCLVFYYPEEILVTMNKRRSESKSASYLWVNRYKLR